MNEKLVRLTSYSLAVVLSVEAGAVGYHYKDNLECRPPVDQAGCLPAAPDWLLTPHIEANGNYTSSAAAVMGAVVSASGTPSGLVWVK